MVSHLRVNSLRISNEEFEKVMEKYELKKIDWIEGVYSTEHEKMGNTLEYQTGLFYIQSLSSMVPVFVLKPTKKDIILDMAAAPGSKTTQIAIEMENEGVIIANDISYNRMKSLSSHIDRLGILNIGITCFDGLRFPGYLRFNKILIDAPCSGIGSRKVCEAKSENRIKSLSKLQKNLILKSFDLLLPGGELVYSTCTTTYEENESVLEKLFEKRENALPVEFELPFEAEKGFSSNKKVEICSKRYELDESFFIAKIKKRSKNGE